MLKLGKGVWGSLTRFCLEEFCWLGFIVPMWEEKKLSFIYTWDPFLCPTSNGSSSPPSHFQPLGWKPTFSRIFFPSHINTVNSVHTSATNIAENTMKIKKCMPAVIFLLKTTLFSEFQNKVKHKKVFKAEIIPVSLSPITVPRSSSWNPTSSHDSHVFSIQICNCFQICKITMFTSSIQAYFQTCSPSPTGFILLVITEKLFWFKI